MRSSTSSSDIYVADRDVPTGAWLKPFVFAVLAFCVVVSMLEGVLAMRGFKPTVVDSQDRWAHERERAVGFGHRALILIGASRAQLDIDLPTLKSYTGLLPVQLAIDGNSYVPVLQDLAEDERVTGTVVVEYQDTVMRGEVFQDRSVEYVAYSRRLGGRNTRLDFNASENALAQVRQSWMRSYADGAGPWASLLTRVMDPRAVPQYLVTLPSRQREANYSLVPMPQFYFQRVMRNAGISAMPPVPDFDSLNRELGARIAGFHPLDAPGFADRAGYIGGLVRRIEARGGRVIFVMFPKSGLVWSADNQRFPRSLYWDRFIAITGSRGIHFKDVPALAEFRCPDGSHLDVRDQARFTQVLAEAMIERDWIARPH